MVISKRWFTSLSILCLTSCTESSSSSDGKAVDHQAQVRTGGAICAVSLDDVSSVLSAYRDSDSEALAGLMSRNKAILLKEGTRVHVLTQQSGVDGITIDSGTYSGERCWIYEPLIHYLERNQ